jgi:beta-lactamase superfamily II metal-dependent hydrolase
VSYGQFNVLLTGDATFHTENAIMARYPSAWLDVDVMKIGHHGSKWTSTSDQWADTVKAEVAIASAAFTAKHGHPADEIRSRLERHATTAQPHKMRWWYNSSQSYNDDDYAEAIYCTARSGNILVTSDGQSFTVEYED